MFTEQPNFANKCKNILESLKTDKKNDVANGNYNRNWADTLIKLAENQVIIAEYMAQQTEEQQRRTERERRQQAQFVTKGEMAEFTGLVIGAILLIAVMLVYLIWFI